MVKPSPVGGRKPAWAKTFSHRGGGRRPRFARPRRRPRFARPQMPRLRLGLASLGLASLGLGDGLASLGLRCLGFASAVARRPFRRQLRSSAYRSSVGSPTRPSATIRPRSSALGSLAALLPVVAGAVSSGTSLRWRLHGRRTGAAFAAFRFATSAENPYRARNSEPATPRKPSIRKKRSPRAKTLGSR